MNNKEIEYIEGVGFVAYIDGEKVIYDRDELPELKERLRKEKEKYTAQFSHIQTPYIMNKPEEELSFKEFIARNIHKFPQLSSVFDSKP